MTPPEILPVTFEGHPILCHLTHEDAVQILSEAGWHIPAIPEGCNTSLFYFTTKEGFEALAVNQRDFTPIASDNERQVNGVSVLISLDRNMDRIDARALLQRYYQS